MVRTSSPGVHGSGESSTKVPRRRPNDLTEPCPQISHLAPCQLCVRTCAGRAGGGGKGKGGGSQRVPYSPDTMQECASKKPLRPAAWIFRVPGGVIMAHGLGGRGECTCTQREKRTRYLSYTVSGAANQVPGLVHSIAHPHHIGNFLPIPSFLLPVHLLFFPPPTPLSRFLLHTAPPPSFNPAWMAQLRLSMLQAN